jgi:hypothetical protein
MNEAASEARNRHALATSGGWPMRPNGTVAATALK